MEFPTMTLHDCCEALRANQVPISERILGQMIQEGKLPFAIGTQLDTSERSKYLIFRPAFYRWLEEMMGAEVIRIYRQAIRGGLQGLVPERCLGLPAEGQRGYILRRQ